MTPLEVATRALELLSKGWVQGSYTGAGGCFCMAGAVMEAEAELGCLAKATLNMPDTGSVLRVAADEIRKADPTVPNYPAPSFGENHNTVTNWNDDPHRTQAEVVAMMGKTIAALDAEQTHPAVG